MDTNVTSWAQRIWEDLQPTPGRLSGTLRIVLASILTLLLLMVLQMPFASLGLYYVFLIGRDSPSVSLRSSIYSLLALAASVAAVFIVVILSDNDPMARVLSVAIVTFIAGMLMFASTIPTLASTWGFIFATLIALWETQTSADTLVKTSLYLLGTIGLGVGCSVAVEYIFGSRHPAEELQEQRCIRYEALETMFSLYARGAPPAEISPAANRVSRLAAAGQTKMQELYNTIVDRNLDTGNLPIGARVRLTMLAQLMDVAAAFGSQNPTVNDPALQQRCAHIAELCRELNPDVVPAIERESELTMKENPSLLDRVDASLHAIVSMPIDTATHQTAEDKELVALPSKKIPLLIPGALKSSDTLAFALKLSLCATTCYIIYNAVGWPGISTSVATVLITGLSSSGAIKQKLIFRLLGAAIGGLILGLGATVFLFPYMDSITSLVVLIGVVAFIAAWWASGRQFNYVGLQIAFAFYIVAFEGFSAPTELAPARDRLIGILLALVVMAFVFDLLWPVRTVTAMRKALASMLRSESSFLRLLEKDTRHSDFLFQADILRDQIGKTVSGIRTMAEAVEYEFGVDRKEHERSSHVIIGIALTSAALFWNQFAFLHSEQDIDFLTQPPLVEMRRELANRIDAMAMAVVEKTPIPPANKPIVDPSLLDNSRYGEYVRNSVARYEELQAAVSNLSLHI
jgi:multidrug resistance protein MdtO